MKKLLAIIFILIIILFILWYLFPYLSNYTTKLGKDLNILTEEFEPLKIKILSNNNKKIEFLINFYDKKGNTISSNMLSINGETIFVDILVVKLKESYLFFPNKLFTNSVPANEGIDLVNLYTNNNLPLIYDGENDFNFIKQIFIDLIKERENKNIKLQYGNAVHVQKQYNEIRANDYLFIKMHPKKGGVEIIQN